MLKILSILLTTFFSFYLSGQKNDSVFLKWKLRPKEIITYRTTMQEMPGEKGQEFSDKFDDLLSLFDTSKNMSDKKSFDKFFHDMNEIEDNNDLITKLSRNKKGLIDIEMTLQPKKDAPASKADSNDAEKLLQLTKTLSGDVVIRGQINENGGIESFYTKWEQKNLIALFFQLPARPLIVGDKWDLDVHLISFDEHFTCDSSYKKNYVQLIALKQQGDDTIAVIKYEVEEFATGDFESPFTGKKKTTLKMAHSAIAEFSIQKGRWLSYNGIMLVSGSGVINASSKKRIALVLQ